MADKGLDKPNKNKNQDINEIKEEFNLSDISSPDEEFDLDIEIEVSEHEDNEKSLDTSDTYKNDNSARTGNNQPRNPKTGQEDIQNNENENLKDESSERDDEKNNENTSNDLGNTEETQEKEENRNKEKPNKEPNKEESNTEKPSKTNESEGNQEGTKSPEKNKENNSNVRNPRSNEREKPSSSPNNVPNSKNKGNVRPNNSSNFKPSAQKPASKPAPKTLNPENKKLLNKDKAINSFANRFNLDSSKMKADSIKRKTERAQKFANRARKIANSAKAAGKTIISVLLNPYTWIVIGIVFVLIFAIVASFATVQTIGKNDLADGCYGIGNKGTTSLTFNEEDDIETRANKMATWLLEQPSWEVNDGNPLTREQAFAIVGNFMAESNLEPKKIEQSAPNWEAHLDDNNEQIYTWTRDLTAKGRNVGLGLAQWTWNPGRAESLINKAKETNSKWYEIQPQVELLKEEMDSPEYANELKRRGFSDESKDEGELAIIFHDGFERSADNAEMKARRAKFATETKEKYTKMGSTGGKTMGGSCTRNGSVNTSDAVELAKSIAWEPEQKERANTPKCECGRAEAKPEYQDAKDALQENPETADPHIDGELFNSCDRVVVTIVKTMWDPDIPWGPVVEVDKYFTGKGKEKWEEVDIKDAEPGDVFISANNSENHPDHLAFYIGDYNGMDAVVEGSHTERVALISNAYEKGTAGFKAYRFVGDPVRSGLGKVSI